MNVIVLGGGVVGVTTAYYLLKHGHEVTQIERQPGVARECSHTNGGFVAISQAVTWSAGRADQDLQDHGAARRADPDPPLPAAAHLALGLDFLRASRPGPSWANTRHVLRLSLYSFESLKEIRAATGVQYDAVHRRRPQGLSEPERASMTSPPSSWMTSAAPFITLTAFGPGARPVDEATEATRISVGTASLTVHCGDRPCDRCGRHEQPPNHGAPPTLVVAIAADEP